MPVYQCHRRKSLLAKGAKTKTADEITTIHTNVTRAPELYVNVLFHEIPEGDCFVARQPSTHSYLFGTICHGRDPKRRQAMLRELWRM